MSQNNSNEKAAMLAKLDSTIKLRDLTRLHLLWIIRISIHRKPVSASLS